MIATGREKETVACANSGSVRPAITLAPVAEHVPTDDVIESLKPMASDDSLFRVEERADLASKRRFVNALRKRRKAFAREQPADVMVG